jgi:hypothetical protein
MDDAARRKSIKWMVAMWRISENEAALIVNDVLSIMASAPEQNNLEQGTQ